MLDDLTGCAMCGMPASQIKEDGDLYCNRCAAKLVGQDEGAVDAVLQVIGFAILTLKDAVHDPVEVVRLATWAIEDALAGDVDVRLVDTPAHSVAATFTPLEVA